MAINIATRQWEIEAGDESSTVIYKGVVTIGNIIFTDYDADTDTFEIRDRNDNLIASGTGTSDLAPVVLQFIGRVDGLKVTVLTSGRLVIYTE